MNGTAPDVNEVKRLLAKGMVPAEIRARWGSELAAEPRRYLDLFDEVRTDLADLPLLEKLDSLETDSLEDMFPEEEDDEDTVAPVVPIRPEPVDAVRDEARSPGLRRWGRWLAAAAVLLALSSPIWFGRWFGGTDRDRPAPVAQLVAAPQTTQLAPGAVQTTSLRVEPGQWVRVTALGPPEAWRCEWRSNGSLLRVSDAGVRGERHTGWWFAQGATVRIDWISESAAPVAIQWSVTEVREGMTAEALADAAGAAVDRALEARARGGAQDKEAALAAYSEAIDIWTMLDRPKALATSENAAGLVAYQSSRFPLAVELLTAALARREEMGTPFELAQTLNNLGLAYLGLGQPRRAAPLLHRALPLWEEGGHERETAFTLNCLGGAFDQLDQPEQALDYYGRAREMLLPRDDKDSLFARALVANNIGVIHNYLGDALRASGALEEALRLWRRLDTVDGEAQTLVNLGWARRLAGETEAERELYRRALTLARERGSLREEAFAQHNLGMADLERGRLDRARSGLQAALELRERQGDARGAAWSRFALAEVAERQEDHPAARRFRTEAAQAAAHIGDVNLQVQVATAAAQAARGQGHWLEATDRISEAVTWLEGQRQKVKNFDFRASYLASRMDTFATYIDILMDRHRLEPEAGHAAAALEVAERARARGLLDLLHDAAADYWLGPDPALVARREALLAELNTTERRLRRLAQRPEKNREEIEGLEGKRADLKADYASVERRIRESGLRFEHPEAFQPLSLAEIRKAAPERGALVQIWSGSERGYLWTVTRDALDVRELPDRARLDALAKSVLDAWSDPSGARTPEAAQTLADLLFAPETLDAATRRLAVVADGALQFVPLQALPVPKRLRTSPDASRIVDRVDLVNLPSFSTLALLPEDSWPDRADDLSLAVYADPVFSADDPRWGDAPPASAGELQVAATEPAVPRTRATIADRLDRQARLPATAAEAAAVAALFPKADRVVRLGFEARRDRIVGGDLAKRDLVHLATHGVLDGTHPERSGLVLSRYAEDGSRIPALLGLYDIYDLELRAQLVVLSACQTAFGKEVRGEGVLGLTRGFLSAGSPRVVASLWQVEDRATAVLMSQFYEELARGDVTPVTALRSAQAELRRDPRFAHPFYWAGFQYHGAWW
ncbi:CHAT domain-containing protein [Sulfidibacter corallicola]|uniref:CHAT domain-containing protein n=1 Tax=Sulfidibacter corallicola TaxID=2818388 RepID=A0A8A4TL86_SULCO|nr:CHAT domain-containing protein [Sulfidibacter corallicola]QTD50333.1 CHAT domain-containing protein [Sulfidibacter corallicola]